MLIMSGAFSIYKKKDLLNVGGFLTKINDHPYIQKTIGTGKATVTEDMEIVIRLWRYFRENRIKAKVKFLPDPVCWTEVPDNAKNLFKQRVRWQLGLAETLKIHRKLLFEPKYGATAMIAMPYYVFFELISPIIKIFTFVFLIFASIFWVTDVRFAVNGQILDPTDWGDGYFSGWWPVPSSKVPAGARL